jgi:hypothetical protein
MFKPELGSLVTSPKHGNGQIVDQRGHLYIVQYNGGTFRSYRESRLLSEFKVGPVVELPPGFPKIALAPQKQLDTRPYLVYYVDFRAKKVLRKETNHD